MPPEGAKLHQSGHHRGESTTSAALDLSGRDLETLSGLEEVSATDLRTLKIAQNRLKTLKGLVPMFNLLEFDASSNELVEVSQLIPFPKLEKLNLSSNKIVRITSAIPELVKELDISNNNIYTADLITPVLSLQFLESLDIRGNPLANKKEASGLLIHFPLLKYFNGRDVSEQVATLTSSKGGPATATTTVGDVKEDLTLSNLNVPSKKFSRAASNNDAAPVVKKNPKLMVNEQVVLFSKHNIVKNYNTSQKSGVTTNIVRRGVSNTTSLQAIVTQEFAETAGPNKVMHNPSPQQKLPMPQQSLPRASDLPAVRADSNMEPRQFSNVGTMPQPEPEHVSVDIQTDLTYKNVRRRTMYDCGEDNDDDVSGNDTDETLRLSLPQSEAAEARRLRWIRKLLKASEQVVDSSHIHTLQGQIQGYKEEMQVLRDETKTLNKQIEALQLENMRLESSLKPAETISYAEGQALMQKNQMSEVEFLREQVKALEVVVNKQEGASVVQFPVPEEVPQYLSMLNNYRRKLFHAVLGRQRLEHELAQARRQVQVLEIAQGDLAEKATAATVVTANILEVQSCAEEAEQNLEQITEEYNILKEKHREVCSKLSMTEHAAQNFHDKILRYVDLFRHLHTVAEDTLVAPLAGALDEHLESRIAATIQANTVSTFDDTVKYALTVLAVVSSKLNAYSEAVATVREYLNDRIAENHVLRSERDEFSLKVAQLVKERDELYDDNMMMKDALRSQREERQRLEEIRAFGILDKAVLCTAAERDEIVHDATQTCSDEFHGDYDVQATTEDDMQAETAIPPGAFDQAGGAFGRDDDNLLRLSDGSFDSAEEEEEPDPEYELLMQMKDIADRSKAANCTIVPSSVLLKLNIKTEADDTPESTLDGVLRAILGGQRLDLQMGTQDDTESETPGRPLKPGKKERVHVGVQLDSPRLTFRGIQCELLQSHHSRNGSFLSDLQTNSLCADNSSASLLPPRAHTEPQKLDDGVFADSPTTAVASTQIDAPDMRYFGIQTEDVDIAPAGTIVALQTQASATPTTERPLEVETKTTGMQCEIVILKFKNVQCNEKESRVFSAEAHNDNSVVVEARSGGLLSPMKSGNIEISIQTDDALQDAAQGVARALELVDRYVDNVLSASIGDHAENAAEKLSDIMALLRKITAHQSSTQALQTDATMNLLDAVANESLIRLTTPPATPYIEGTRLEDRCDMLEQLVYQKEQHIIACQVEIRDMSGLVSEFSATITAAEGKVSGYKTKLREKQVALDGLQDTVSQLRETVALAEAKEVEHAARIKLLEDLLECNNKDSNIEHTEEVVQTRINLMDMKLLFTQMRVSTTTASTQYDLKEVQDAAQTVRAVRTEKPAAAKDTVHIEIPREAAIDNASLIEYMCSGPQESPFTPTIIPLTPPFASLPSSSESDSERTAVRDNHRRDEPVVRMKISAAKKAPNDGRINVSIFHPTAEHTKKAVKGAGNHKRQPSITVQQSKGKGQIKVKGTGANCTSNTTQLTFLTSRHESV